MKKRINLISHFLGNEDQIISDIRKIFKSSQLTNNGPYHFKFINKIASYLNIKESNLGLACNGTMALILGLKAMNIHSKVIVSPYTFPATINFLDFLNIEPIFCDIDKETLCIDPSLVEKYIDKEVTAILLTNVYGNYPNYEVLQNIARKNKISIISDSSHAFLQTINGRSILEFGDMSIMSLHASKLLNSIEGGIIYFKNKKFLNNFNLLKNFGIKDEITINLPGINGKLNEIQCAVGINNLKGLTSEIRARKKIVNEYIKCFSKLGKKIKILLSKDNCSYQYMPFLFEGQINKKSKRDLIYESLKKRNIFSRKYFYPLTSNYKFNRRYETSSIDNLPCANHISKNVLCLPLHGRMNKLDVMRIYKVVASFYE